MYRLTCLYPIVKSLQTCYINSVEQIVTAQITTIPASLGFFGLLKLSISQFFQNLGRLITFWLVEASISLVAMIPLIIGIALITTKNTIPGTILTVIGAIIGIFVIVALQAASYYQIQSFVDTTPKSIRDLLALGRKLALPLLLTLSLLALVTFLGYLLLIIPGIIFSVWFTFVIVIMINENVWGLAALKSSRNLVKGRFWKVAGYSAFCLVLTFIYSLAVSLLTSIIPGAKWIGQLFSSILNIPIQTISLLFIYNLYHKLK